METIVLIFTHSQSWFSRLVCFLTGSRWSHVAIGVMGGGYDSFEHMEWFSGPPDHVIDARRGVGVLAPRTLRSFLLGYPDHVAYAVPVSSSHVAALFLQGQLTKSYDSAGLFGFLMPWRSWQQEDKWYCFELAACALYYGGAPQRAKLVLNAGSAVSGRQLLNFVQENGYVVDLNA